MMFRKLFIHELCLVGKTWSQLPYMVAKMLLLNRSRKDEEVYRIKLQV